MPLIQTGKKIPDFSASATSQKTIKSKDLRGKNIVLYFYPKDSTPGCTQQGQDFRDNFDLFNKKNTVILGVSRDSLESHEKFKKNQNFPFELISDHDEKLCKEFDVIKEKNMYGKKYLGIERSTFLIDDRGILRKEWRKVRVKGHVDEVISACEQL
ncbi:MAG: peroxiredoxin [Rhodospirillaceae bacterium]|nr:peroxiredoxin [Rhodospirillaceae bacterium]|tara:strand:- start:237 stop:704 length:468 start_codon:yes stop_codon:yes gene_type:complete